MDRNPYKIQSDQATRAIIEFLRAIEEAYGLPPAAVDALALGVVHVRMGNHIGEEMALSIIEEAPYKLGWKQRVH